MNISACRSSLASLARVLRYTFSDHHAPKPTKLDKVDKKMYQPCHAEFGLT